MLGNAYFNFNFAKLDVRKTMKDAMILSYLCFSCASYATFDKIRIEKSSKLCIFRHKYLNTFV